MVHNVSSNKIQENTSHNTINVIKYTKINMKKILKKHIMGDKVYLIKIPQKFTANTINVLKISKEIK